MHVDQWKKILVLQTSFLGDTILSLPLLAKIKHRFPQMKLTLLCTPQSQALLLDQPGVDHMIVDDKRGADRGWVGLWRKARALRQMNFDAALTPHKSLRSALLLFFAGIPNRIGFRQSKGWFLFHHRAEREYARHDVERNLSLLRVFGIEPQECDRVLNLAIDNATQQAVARRLRSLGVNLEKPIVGINPASVWPTKRWSAEGFARVIQVIKRDYDCEALLFGGPADLEIAARIQQMSDSAAVNLAGKLSLRELAAALSLCNVLITNDSGPMHVAVARGVPTVAIFCATTPSLGFYPYTSNAVVLGKNLSCRPCTSHGGRRCPLGTEDCIRLIQPEDVLRAAEKFLSAPADSRARAVVGYEPAFVTI